MKKFDIYLKCLMIFNFLLLSACQNVSESTPKLNSPYKINVNLSDWKLMDQNVKRDVYLQLYDPISEKTIKKESIIIVYIKVREFSLDKYLEKEIDQEKRMCESTSQKIIAQDSNSIIFYSKMDRCRMPSFHKQIFKIEKIFRQSEGPYINQFYAISYLATDEVDHNRFIYMKQAIISSNLVKNVKH